MSETDLFDDDNIIKSKSKKTRKRFNYDEFLHLIEQKVRIPNLVSLERDNHAVCPFIGNTPPHRSFVYYPETESWNCFHPECGGGNVINLYQELNRIATHGEACKQIAKEYKIEYQTEEWSEKDIDTQQKVHEIWEDFMLYCQSNLKNSEYYAKEKNKRGFTDWIMETFKVGLVNETVQEFFTEKYGNELLFESGFIGKGKKNWIMGKRIVYPYLDYNNKPIYFIFRLIPEEPDFGKDRKYIKLAVSEVGKDNEGKETLIERKFVRNQLFGLNSLKMRRIIDDENKQYDHPKELIITEGVTDAISVIQAGFPCLSPVTVRFRNEDYEPIIQHCKRFEKIIVIQDNEKPKEGSKYCVGLQGSIDTATLLYKNGIQNVYIGILPEKYKDNEGKVDINSFMAEIKKSVL